MKRYFLDTPYGQIHYVVEGFGDPLILLHQAPRSIDEYAKIIPILSRNYRIIAMDTLGAGIWRFRQADRTAIPGRLWQDCSVALGQDGY